MAANVKRTLTGGGCHVMVKNINATKVAGKLIACGDVVALLLKDATANEENVPALIDDVEIEYAKLTTDDFTPGAIVYFDAGNDRLTLTASTHKKAGIACTTTAGSAPTGRIWLGKIR